MNKKSVIATIITILAILIIDQTTKFLVKTNMELGQSITIFSWFQIAFTENPGFAFGMEIGGSWGKLALSLFRVVAVAAIAWFLIKIIREKQSIGLTIGIAALFAGAIGNIIDSAFYGLIFDKGLTFNSDIGYWVPYAGLASADFGGYAPMFHGCVVDMLYFPLIEGTFPDWLPFWGGDDFVFFRPIFNIADSAISVSIVYLLIFQRKALSKLLH